MSAAVLLALFAAGIFTGALGALLGLGGGVFLVPALVLWFGADISHAAGAGLVAVIATSCAGAAVNVDKGIANMRLGLVLELSTVLGALCGGVLAAYLPARTLIALFGALLAGIGILLWRDGQDEAENGGDAAAEPGPLGGSYYDPAAGRVVSYAFRRLSAALGAGFAAGNLSGLLGVGGGVLKVPVMHLYCGMPMKAAAATSNFTIGVTAAAGAIVYFARGALDPLLSAVVALGVLLGSQGGLHLSARLRDRSVRRAFALVAALLAFGMLRRALGG